MEEFKLKWEMIDGSHHVSEWLTEKQARKLFESKKSDLNNQVMWCELLFASLEENAMDEEQVIDSFERRKMNFMGMTVLF